MRAEGALPRLGWVFHDQPAIAAIASLEIGVIEAPLGGGRSFLQARRLGGS